MKVLRVGDPHVKVTNLLESQSLLNFVFKMATEHKVDRIELLGDLFHTHAVLRLEVVEFWSNWLEVLSDDFEVVVLVGNHDRSGDSHTNVSALSVFARLKRPKLHIIEKPTQMGVFAYVPYIHECQQYIDQANNLYNSGAKTLVSHTTYSGSKFENGFFAPDGVDPEALHYDLCISGHIHSRQRIRTNRGQTIIYPGTARWDTASDANQPKGLWLCEHNADGSIAKEEFLDTSHVCSPIVAVELREGEELPKFPDGARIAVELIGSSDWVSKQKSALKGRCSIRTKITDSKRSESRKAGTSFTDFVSNIYVTTMDKQYLLKFMKEIGLV